MKISQLYVFLTFIAFFGLGYAANSPLFSSSTPVQSYQSAGSASVHNAQVKSEQVSKSIKTAGNPLANTLKSQMAQLNQASLLNQERTDQKIETLRSQTKTLQTQLHKLTEAMVLMNQQLAAQRLSHDAPKKLESRQYAFDAIFKYLSFGLLALLTVVLGALLAREKTS